MAKICAALFICGILAPATTATARAQSGNEPVISQHSALKFGPFPNVPACAAGAAERGEPTKEASTLLVRLASGCRVPWHWHTPNETVLMVRGALRGEMKAATKPMWLHASDYAWLPAHSIHEAQCISKVPCTFFLHTDAAFDIHYVDPAGNEIPMSEALKPAAKKPVAKSKAAAKTR